MRKYQFARALDIQFTVYLRTQDEMKKYGRRVDETQCMIASFIAQEVLHNHCLPQPEHIQPDSLGVECVYICRL